MNLNASLAQWLKYQEETHPLEIDLGLERVQKIAARLPSLQKFSHKFKFHKLDSTADFANIDNQAKTEESATRDIKIISVAGTNGKGSSCVFLQNLLLESGYSTGLYTSPHIKNYNERFCLNGIEASDEQLVEAFNEIQAHKQDISLSYFEWATLAAFVLFAKFELEFWILEVGLGGRLDAVNITNADVSIITSIGKDHEEYLGTSLNAIASEKAGILCKNQTLIYAARLMPLAIADKAKEVGANLFRAGEAFSFSEDSYNFTWQGLDYQHNKIELSLPKLHIAAANASAALQAFCLVQPVIDKSFISQAVRNTKLVGRMQRIGDFLLDVAHNPPAMVHLTNRLENKDRIAIIGMLSDKDITRSLQILTPYLTKFFMVSLPTARGTSKEAMFAYGVKAGIDKNKMQLFSSIEEAIDIAKDLLAKRQTQEVLILGSFVTLNLALDFLQPFKE